MISNISKYLVLVVLSCSFLLTWNGVRNNFIDLNIITNEVESVPNVTPVTSIVSVKQKDTLWKNISNDFALDHKERSKRVQKEIHRILANQHKLQKILTDASPYLYYIYQQTQARGLPAELALIPFVESEFNPNDHSNKGALGLWQIMPQTARELGIRVRNGYDGRRNVINSTKAALAYFKDLGKMFKGNWYLAIAAYNAGQGKVSSVSRHAGSKDFWRLPLPTETKLYVPRLLAIAEIVQHPKKYGVTLPQISNEPYFKQVNVKKQISLNKFAQTSGVNVKTLQALNPDLKRAGVVVAQENGAHTVLVPVNKSKIA